MQSPRTEGFRRKAPPTRSVTVPTARSSFAFGCDAGFARRPPEQRLDMPAQPLSTRRSKPERETDGGWRFLVIAARALTVTGFASRAMLSTFSAGGVNVLEWIAVVLFAVNFGYLSIAAFTGVAGTIILLASPKAPPPSKDVPTKGNLTAIIIALYQEKPAKVIAAAEAMWDFASRTSAPRKASRSFS